MRCVERRSNSGWRRGCWRSRSCYKVMYYARRGAVQYTSAATPARMFPGKGGPPASQRLRLSIRQHAAACAAACRCMRGRPLQDEIRTQPSVGGVSALDRARQVVVPYCTDT